MAIDVEEVRLRQARQEALALGQAAAGQRARALWAPLPVQLYLYVGAGPVGAGPRAVLMVAGFPSAEGDTWDEAIAAALAGPASLERTLPARFYAEPSPRRAGELAVELAGHFLAEESRQLLALEKKLGE